MGCWNETCGVSNLPIRVGTDVVMFLLKPRYSGSKLAMRTYYPTDNYEPLYTAIRGKYNDYGGIEEIESDYRLVDYLNNLEIKYMNDDNIIEKVAFSHDKSDFEKQFNDFLHKSHDGNKYFLPDYAGESCFLNYMFVDAGVHDYLINKMGKRKPYKQKDFLSTLIENKLDNKVKNEFLQLVEIKEIDDEKGNDNKFKGIFYQRIIDDNFNGICSNEMNILIADYFKGRHPEFKKNFVDLVIFSYVLSYMRKGWLCLSGIGSQCEELQLHRDLAELILSSKPHTKILVK